MNPNIAKPEKFDHLLLVYHFTVTLIRKTWDDRFAGKVGGGGILRNGWILVMGRCTFTDFGVWYGMVFCA